tara:strand:+ start:3782 stop:3961 length:180 start_codon:yes stop_codon:yes gene_type:complete
MNEEIVSINGDIISVTVDDDLYLRVKLGITEKYLTEEQLAEVNDRTEQAVTEILRKEEE